MAQTESHNSEVLGQFSRQAEGYAKLVEGERGKAPNPALAVIDPRADDIALDIACGTGSLTLQLAGHVTRVTGIDLTPAMIEQARLAAAKQGATGIVWDIGDIASLPYADDSFTLVTCSAAFHHLERPAAVLAEMRRVCRPGGRVAVIDLAPPADKAGAFDVIERMRDPSHVRARPLAELHAIAAGCGLSDPVSLRFGGDRPIPYDAVLGTSFPTIFTVDQIRSLVEADAHSGEDRFGLSPAFGDGRLNVCYPMAASVWTV